MTTLGSTPSRPEPLWRHPIARIRFEAEVAARLMADNAAAAILPPLLFTAAASEHYRLDVFTTVQRLAASTALFTLYLYVFDASNQAHDPTEDRVNKPHRPVPRGLITPQGARRRFQWAMPIYTLTGWLTGTLVWVLLWQALVVVLNCLTTPRQGVRIKPLVMLLGTIAQLAAAWRIVAPLDATGWTWVLVISIAFNLPLPFEDVRDMAGDRQIGRLTIALTIGHWPVRIWFASVMACLPIALHLLLFAPSHAGPTVLACDTAIAALSWTAAACGLLIRTVFADRVTYLLYNFTYCAALASGLVLL